jgi:hypothetical protein
MKDRELVRALKALADPTRFRMVQEIAAAGELSCGQNAEHFDVSQPTICYLKIWARGSSSSLAGKHHHLGKSGALTAHESLPARPRCQAQAWKSPAKASAGRYRRRSASGRTPRSM